MINVNVWYSPDQSACEYWKISHPTDAPQQQITITTKQELYLYLMQFIHNSLNFFVEGACPNCDETIGRWIDEMGPLGGRRKPIHRPFEGVND
jgi:hypothetical protein